MVGASTSATPSCNSKPIYKQESGDWYLFLPTGQRNWVVGSHSAMSSCSSWHAAVLQMQGGCSQSPALCPGRWQASTGTEGQFRYANCDGVWCDDPNVQIH